MYRFPFLILATLGVSACGGSDSNVITPVTPPAAQAVLALTARPNATSPVVGVAILDQTARVTAGRPLFETTKAATTRIDGTYNHKTQVAALSGADIAYEAVRGSRGTFDPDSRLEIATKSFDHMRVSQEFLLRLPNTGTGPDRALTSFAIYGIATPKADFPAGGTASYAGVGQLSIDAPTFFTSYQTDVTVTADFGTNRVGMTMLATGESGPDDILNGLEMRNMRINGSRITGGTPVFTLDGDVVKPFAGSFDKFSQGQFYGTANNAPDEVGGIAQLTDGDMTVTGAYIAD